MTILTASCHPDTSSSAFAGPPNKRLSPRAAIATMIGVSLSGWALVLGTVGTLL